MLATLTVLLLTLNTPQAVSLLVLLPIILLLDAYILGGQAIFQDGVNLTGTGTGQNNGSVVISNPVLASFFNLQVKFSVSNFIRMIQIFTA